MTAALVVFLGAVLVPAFFARLHALPWWLVLQAAALAWVEVASAGHWDLHTLAGVLELLLMRGVLAPWLLVRALAHRSDAGADLMPSNLFAWSIALALIALGFQFGAPDGTGLQGLALGAVAATVAVALWLLASNDAPPAQLVALLVLENALALFETQLPQAWPWTVHLALSAVYVLTVGVGAWLLAGPGAERSHAA